MRGLCRGPGEGQWWLGGQGVEDKELSLDWKLRRRGCKGSVVDRRDEDRDGLSDGVDGGGHTGSDVWGQSPGEAPAQVDAG